MYKVNTILSRLFNYIKSVSPFTAHQLTIKYWPTKPYYVWLVIQFLLFQVKPKLVLELGSGRSSHYYAEYAEKENAVLVSVEQNIFYYLKNKVGFNFSFLNPNFLHYVPLSDDWFDISILNKLIKARVVDFIMIDAPGGGNSKGSRNSLAGNNYMSELLSSTKVFVIDDFQREEVYSSFRFVLANHKSRLDAFLISLSTL